METRDLRVSNAIVSITRVFRWSVYFLPSLPPNVIVKQNFYLLGYRASCDKNGGDKWTARLAFTFLSDINQMFMCDLYRPLLLRRKYVNYILEYIFFLFARKYPCVILYTYIYYIHI